jgi:hypothetical protein
MQEQSRMYSDSQPWTNSDGLLEMDQRKYGQAKWQSA